MKERRLSSGEIIDKPILTKAANYKSARQKAEGVGFSTWATGVPSAREKDKDYFAWLIPLYIAFSR